MVHKRQKVRRQNGNNNVREAKQSWKCVNTNPQKCGEQRSSAMVAPLSPKEDGDYVQQKVEGQSSTTTGWPSESERLIQSIPSQETKVIRVTCPEKTENQRKLSLAIGSPDPPTKFTTNHDVKSSSSSANNDLQHGVTEDTELPVSSTASRSKKAVLGNVTNQSSTEFIRITTNDSCMLNNGNTGSTDSSADVSELQTTTNTKSLSEIQGCFYHGAPLEKRKRHDTKNKLLLVHTGRPADTSAKVDQIELFVTKNMSDNRIKFAVFRPVPGKQCTFTVMDTAPKMNIGRGTGTKIFTLDNPLKLEAGDMLGFYTRAGAVSYDDSDAKTDSPNDRFCYGTRTFPQRGETATLTASLKRRYSFKYRMCALGSAETFR